MSSSDSAAKSREDAESAAKARAAKASDGNAIIGRRIGQEALKRLATRDA